MSEIATPYTSGKSSRRESADSLRARIPGWGVDLDPAERPSFPREQPGIETGAHWLLLIAADRVDAWEHHLRSLATLRPDNAVTETGVLGEFPRHGSRSRFGRRRVDVNHQWMDPVLVGAPWVLAGLGAAVAVRGLARRSSAPAAGRMTARRRK